MEDKINKFWAWFEANQYQIIDAVENGSETDYIVGMMDNLVLDIGKFAWEIAEGKTERWSLTISPNGDKNLLKISKKIMEAAPALAAWEFNPFKPAKAWDRNLVIYNQNMDECLIDASGWSYVALKYEDGSTDLILEAENIAYLDEDTASTAANLTIINEVGEEVKILKISKISIVEQLVPEYREHKAPIQYLKKLLL